jgi:hypothetical protein
MPQRWIVTAMAAGCLWAQSQIADAADQKLLQPSCDVRPTAVRGSAE